MNLNMELEDGELILSVYKRATRAKTQIKTVTMERGSLTLGDFIKLPMGR